MRRNNPGGCGINSIQRKSYLQAQIQIGRYMLVLWMSALSAATAASGPEVMRLETIPATIKLQQGAHRQVWVVARNISTNAVRLLPLDWTVTPGISVTQQTGDQSDVLPDGGVHWLMDVSRTNESHETGQVFFRLDYKRLDAAGTNGTVNCVTSSLEVQDLPITPLEQLVDVRIESSLKLLQQPQTNAIYVVIKNKANIQITLTSINARAPADINLAGLSGSRVVAPREEAAFEFQINARSSVHPGKHLLLFENNLSWLDEGRLQTGTVLSKYECDVGVIGDSEFLVPVGVPSFLLLPGFLITLVFVMLWNAFHKENRITWDAKKPEFWSLAVIISLLAIAIYRIWGSNLLEGYGLKDVYWVWLGSAAVGAMAWLAVEAGLYLRRTAAARRQQKQDQEKDRKTFKIGDQPLQALRKLGLNNRNFLLRRVKATYGGQTAPAFVLQPAEGGSQTLWIAPQIEVSFDNAPDPKIKADCSREFDDLLKSTWDADRVANFIEGQGHEWIQAYWVASGQLDGPRDLAGGSCAKADGDATGSLVRWKT
jgi:hypothetical protein